MKLADFLIFSKKRRPFAIPEGQVGLAWDDALGAFVSKESDGTESPIGTSTEAVQAALAGETLEVNGLETENTTGTVLVPSTVDSIIYTNKNEKPHVDGTSGSREIVVSDPGVIGLRTMLIERLDAYATGTHVIPVGSFALPATMFTAGRLWMLAGSVGFNLYIPDFTFTSVTLRLRPDNGTHPASGNGLTMPLISTAGTVIANLAAAFDVFEFGGEFYVVPADTGNSVNGNASYTYFSKAKSSATVTNVGGDFSDSTGPTPWFATAAATSVNWLVDLVVVIATKPTSVSDSYLMIDTDLRLANLA